LDTLLLIGCILLIVNFIMTILAYERIEELEKRPYVIADVPVIPEEPAEEPETSFSDADLSFSELARMERDKEFEERIARLSGELGIGSNQQKTQADELHPHVHNLPHNIIPEKKDMYPTVEYTE
jgi:hypothetical protein